MVKRIRFGVIGAGVFGNYHANKCAQNPRIDFVGVFDIDKHRALKTANRHSVKAFSDYAQMLGEVDAVIIACAAQAHGQIAIMALQAGKHCLIEKPIAATLSDAQTILNISQRNKTLTVQIGHQERFVARAIGLSHITERPKAIKAFRMGPYSPRGTDVSVTLDLMSHDLDLVLWLMGQFPKEVRARSKTVTSHIADMSHAKLIFEHGYAELTASRAADRLKRTMEIEYPSGTILIDFVAKTIVHDTLFDLNLDFAAAQIASDSLGAATESFVASIISGSTPAINAQDGYNALKLALMIDEVARNDGC